MQSDIQQETDGSVLIISLCRHSKKNALTADMYAEMVSAISEAESNNNIRCIIITGNEDFTAGNNLADFLNNPPSSADASIVQFMRIVESCTLPIIAAVDGVAVGIGTTMLLHFDLVYCTSRTQFVLPFIDLALVPEFASTLLLPRLAGYVRAAEMLMLGEPFSADKAQEIGLINGVIDHEELQQHALTIAHKLAEKPQEAMLQTKALLKRAAESTPDRITAEMIIFERLLSSSETKQRLKAFLEKK